MSSAGLSRGWSRSGILFHVERLCREGELNALGVLLFTPRLGWAGGILTLGALGGAIVSHITVLGIEVQGDHGLLFAMGVITFVCGFIVTFIHRHEIPSYTPMTPY